MTHSDAWSEPAPEALALPQGEAHLWMVRLPVTAGELAVCEATLSRAERARAAVPIDPADGARFVAVRGILRRLLGRYLGVEARELRFRYGEYGKPELKGGGPVRFNVSHAGGVAVLAFAAEREVGVDVERVRPVRRQARIAERVFAPEVARAWGALPAGRREEGFFREWTKLEAASKLTGAGVWRTVIRQAHHELGEVSWLEVEAPPGYVAALAVEGVGVRLRRYAWGGEG